MDKAKQLNRIMSAFKSVKHPGNDNLLAPDAGDDSDIKFLYDYEGEPWTSVDRSVLMYEYACLSFLSDEGLLYVIPCYLVKVLDEDREDIDRWCDSLLNVLLEKGRGSLSFTSEQFEVIDDVFLRFMERYDDEDNQRDIPVVRKIYRRPFRRMFQKLFARKSDTLE